MMYSQLNYSIAQYRADDLQRVSERERQAASIRAERPAPAATRWVAHLRPAFTLRRSGAAVSKAL